MPDPDPDNKHASLPSSIVPTTPAEPATDGRLWTNPTAIFSRRYIMAEIDPALSTIPLVAFCFMTGFIDSISFTAVFVWCGFQTGNSVQLALALARLFSGPSPHDTSFHPADQQALTSVITFLLGTSLGRLGDRIGARSRLWLSLGTFIQALFTMAAAIAVWKARAQNALNGGDVASDRGDPAWTSVLGFVAVGFMSASLGLQGIMGKRVNTQFATTIVLTTIWCELTADPRLFALRRVASRDHKLIAIFVLFFGGFVGRALIDRIGAAGTLGVGVGIRVLIAIWWVFVPGLARK